MHTHARIHNAKTTTIYNICNCISDICKPICFPKVTPKRLSFQGDVLMLNVGHWRAWHLNSVIASHEAWGVEVQEVRKNEVSVKGERGYERIIYICNSHSANFLKVCLERFFLHDALMSFLTSVCCRFSRPRFSLPYRHFQHSRCSGRVEELLQGDEAERGEHHGYRNSWLEKMCF